MNKCPIQKHNGQNYVVPSFNHHTPTAPSSIIPKFTGQNHNVAGQVKTRIHLKNARGEEMDIYQTQQVLNLLNGNQGNWRINNNISKGRNNKNYRRKNND